MLRELILSFISAFIIQPVEAELKQSLAAVGAPYAVISNVKACAQTAGPALTERATSDPWWATSTSFKVVAGMKDPAEVIATYAPNCREAIDAAVAYLNRPSAALSSHTQAMPDV